MRELTARLAGAGIEGAGGDVRRLVAGALGLSAADVLGAPERVLTPAQLEVLQGFIERRRQHEPVSRILGERDFFGRTFTISPATLDPRPDSESVILAALEIAREAGWMARPLRLLDVGTGSGCLLLSLLGELSQATGLGTDISAAALATAARNAGRLGLAQRVEWRQADGLESIAGPFHMLIANPPYVRTADIADLEPEVRNFDPIEALDGGPDGLAMYRRLARDMANILPAGCWVVLEVGHDQADSVARLLASEGTGIDAARIRIRPDVAGKRRCVAARTLD
ncbi:MAG: peptide chain release factor N(5)-glutamine methyltransferase [Hyphomonadaceae bacterium]|nr:peptide chain release factor N(5)-glutamine methyltransferase [Hyphomonadaceae bacterium]